MRARLTIRVPRPLAKTTRNSSNLPASHPRRVLPWSSGCRAHHGAGIRSEHRPLEGSGDHVFSRQPRVMEASLTVIHCRLRDREGDAGSQRGLACTSTFWWPAFTVRKPGTHSWTAQPPAGPQKLPPAAGLNTIDEYKQPSEASSPPTKHLPCKVRGGAMDMPIGSTRGPRRHGVDLANRRVLVGGHMYPNGPYSTGPPSLEHNQLVMLT